MSRIKKNSREWNFTQKRNNQFYYLQKSKEIIWKADDTWNGSPVKAKFSSTHAWNFFEETFEVEDIRDHRKNKDGVIEYLVKWVGYGERENSYITPDLFSSPLPIKKYWEKIKRNNIFDRERKQRLIEQNNTSKTQIKPKNIFFP